MIYKDLTLWINESTKVFPGDIPAKITECNKMPINDYNTHRIDIPTHIGTHIDFPNHMIKNGKTSDKYDINNLIGRGIYLELNNINYNLIKEGDIVFLSTNHDENDLYNNINYIPESIASKLISKKIKALCLDIPTPDQKPYNVHKMLLKNDILIVENVINMNEIKEKEFNVILSPLKISGVDGCPCRVTIEITKNSKEIK